MLISKCKFTMQEAEKLISELNQPPSKINALGTVVLICASCKKMRDNEGNWVQLKDYIIRRPHVEFSHGICPECSGRLYP